MNAAGNLKDVLEQLSIVHDLARSERDGRRELFAQTVVIQSALGEAIEYLDGELKEVLPAIDQLRRQNYSPERYEVMKARSFFDDEPYMEGAQ